MDFLERRLAVRDTQGERFHGTGEERIAEGEDGGAGEAGRSFLQRLAERRQGKALARLFRQDAEAGETAHQPVQRGCMEPGRPGDLGRGLGAIGEPVGQVELGRRMDDARHPIGACHLHQLRGGRNGFVLRL